MYEWGEVESFLEPNRTNDGAIFAKKLYRRCSTRF